MLPAQHFSPGPPQAAHTEVEEVPLHTRPLAVQMVVVELLVVGVVVQQVTPAALPQSAQTPLEHLVLAAVQ